jgi:hypothetical protein
MGIYKKKLLKQKKLQWSYDLRSRIEKKKTQVSILNMQERDWDKSMKNKLKKSSSK